MQNLKTSYEVIVIDIQTIYIRTFALTQLPPYIPVGNVISFTYLVKLIALIQVRRITT